MLDALLGGALELAVDEAVVGFRSSPSFLEGNFGGTFFGPDWPLLFGAVVFFCGCADVDAPPFGGSFGGFFPSVMMAAGLKAY